MNISVKQYREQDAKPKRSKYGNVKVTVDGVTFDSKREADRWCVLRLLEKAGEISHLELQPVFKLYGKSGPVLIKSKRYHNGRHATWRGDFSYFCPARNARIVEDAKGFRTKEFILKKALVAACYPGVEIVEI